MIQPDDGHWFGTVLLILVPRIAWLIALFGASQYFRYSSRRAVLEQLEKTRHWLQMYDNEQRKHRECSQQRESLKIEFDKVLEDRNRLAEELKRIRVRGAAVFGFRLTDGEENHGTTD